MTKTSTISEKGFDFGAPFNVAITSDLNFARHLHFAGVNGCSYGLWPVQSLGGHIPSIALIGSKADELRAAFKIFHRWSDGSDHDAVDFTIIFLKAGGYLLGIAPEYERCKARTTASDPLVDPIMMGLTWLKLIDTVHPMLLDLKKRHEQALIAPIAISACVADPKRPLSHEGLHTVSGIEPLIKFSCHFLDEDAAKGPTAEIMLKMHKSSEKQRKRRSGGLPKSSPPPRSKLQWLKKRETVLDRVFPVTLFRAKQQSLIAHVAEKLKKFRLRDWQINQGIANLVLSRKICGGLFYYPCVAKSELEDAVVSAARRYVESSSDPDMLAGITPQHIAKQVELDVRYLLKAQGISVPSGDLSKLQAKLTSSGYCQ